MKNNQDRSTLIKHFLVSYFTRTKFPIYTYLETIPRQAEKSGSLNYPLLSGTSLN